MQNLLTQRLDHLLRQDRRFDPYRRKKARVSWRYLVPLAVTIGLAAGFLLY